MAGGSSVLVLSSTEPLRVVETPSHVALELISQFDESPELQDARQEVKQDIKPSIEIRDFVGQNFSTLPFSESERTYFQTLPECNLLTGKSLTMMDSIALYYLYNAILDPECVEEKNEPSLMFMANKRQLLQVGVAYPYEVNSIILPFNISQNQLIEWIKNYWAELSKANEKLPRFKPTFIPKNLKIGLKISQLREQGLTFQEISEQLFDQDPTDERLADYNQVKQIFHRYQDYIKESEDHSKRLINMERIINYPSTDVTD